MRQHAAALVFALAAAAAASHADEPVGDQQGMQLARKYNCQQCHTADKALAGPSFHDIAKKYASDPHARADLATNILNGSVGAWGPNPMPPVAVPEADLQPLIDWILSLTQR